jgi:hypothetical protein
MVTLRNISIVTGFAIIDVIIITPFGLQQPCLQ